MSFLYYPVTFADGSMAITFAPRNQAHGWTVIDLGREPVRIGRGYAVYQNAARVVYQRTGKYPLTDGKRIVKGE